MEKKNIYLLVGGIALVILSIGVSFAWWGWTSTNNTNVTFTINGLDIIATNTDIEGNVDPVSSKENGIVEEFTVKQKGNNGDVPICADFTLTLTTLPTELQEESFKYSIYNGTTQVGTGSFENSKQGDVITIATSQPVTTTESTYKVYVWIDGNMDNPLTMGGKHFLFTLGIIASQQEGACTPSEIKEPSFADDIIEKYNNNKDATPVVNNSINYYYASSESLMQDKAGNIRYYGANPNNYIYFNCDDYSNQTADTCEVWRIIGVFDGKIKLIRNSVIGDYSWDTSEYAVGYGNGYNQWGENGDYKGADLMKLLNPGYSDNTDKNSSGRSITVNNSLYYNAGSGTCYNGKSNKTTSCDFTKTGLKNDQTRNLISKTLYYLGGYKSTLVYSDQTYEYERGTELGASPYAFPTWEGYIALPYASDYGYAADFNSCTLNFSRYNNTSCTSTNWMKSILGTSSRGWLLPSDSSYSNVPWLVDSMGDVCSLDNGAYAHGIAPVLYLESNVLIDGATTGSSTDPYKLMVN